MSRFNKFLFCLIGLVVAGLVVGVTSYDGRDKQPDDSVSVLPAGKDISLSYIHHVATRDGVKEWILDADSAQYVKAQGKTVMTNVSVTFFLDNGNTVHLASREGVLFTDTRNMEVSGDVQVRSGQYELKTDKLFYDHKARSVSTDTPIVVKGKVVRLSGHSMTFCLNTQRALVQGAVKAVFENWTL